MIVTNINLKKLEPSEGMRLTNGTDIGEGDSADNWYEITEEEYNKIMAEREADIGEEEASP